MLIFNSDHELANWAGGWLGMELAKPNTSIGVAHKGKIVAAAVYNNYKPPAIEVTFVTTSPRWASPGAIKAILSYPFIQLGCKRVTAIIEAKNQPARAFLLRLGFKREGVHPHMFDHDDAESYGMLFEDAKRWIMQEKLH